MDKNKKTHYQCNEHTCTLICFGCFTLWPLAKEQVAGSNKKPGGSLPFSSFISFLSFALFFLSLRSVAASRPFERALPPSSRQTHLGLRDGVDLVSWDTDVIENGLFAASIVATHVKQPTSL